MATVGWQKQVWFDLVFMCLAYYIICCVCLAEHLSYPLNLTLLCVVPYVEATSQIWGMEFKKKVHLTVLKKSRAEGMFICQPAGFDGCLRTCILTARKVTTNGNNVFS